MKTLVLCNQKGGVGKSAVATLLSHHLAHRGQRVLAIDLDHQGNFTKPLRLSGRAALANLSADALMTGTPPALPAQPFVLVRVTGRCWAWSGSQPSTHPLPAAFGTSWLLWTARLMCA